MSNDQLSENRDLHEDIRLLNHDIRLIAWIEITEKNSNENWYE